MHENAHIYIFFKTQGQTLKQCGVLLPEPVFTHGQLYVCASRSSSAAGLRFWLGDSIDGHGYHGDEKAEEELRYTHNIIFQAVLNMITIEDTQEACPDTPQPSMASPQDATEGATDPEYVELSEAEQAQDFIQVL